MTAPSSDAPKRAAFAAVLRRFANTEQPPHALFVELIGQVRPRDPRDGEAARNNYRALIETLEQDDRLRAIAREALLRLFGGCEQVSFYTEAGILPNSSFGAELRRRVAHRILPDLADPASLKDVIGLIFGDRRDHLWLTAIAPEQRVRFWRALSIEETGDREALWKTIEALLESAHVLATRIAAMGLEPELLRVNPALSQHASPFLALAEETHRFVDAYRASREGAAAAADEKQLGVFIAQCEDAVRRARRAALREGTSMTLTYLIVRLWQSLERLKLLVGVLAARLRPSDTDEPSAAWALFFRGAVKGVIRRDAVGEHIDRLMGLLALRVTENAGRTGEHYIAATRDEYKSMWFSAAGAGLLIGALALLKVLAAKLDLAPLHYAFLYSLNYAACFVAAYALHFTIATKQPAMTAATLGATLGEASGKAADLERLADLIVDTVRSQIAAILGNVLVAFPAALVALLGLTHLLGANPVAAEKAHHLLEDLHPLESAALFYAAIAGCYLYLSGLITGYFDNRAVYYRLGPRIAALGWLNALLGARRAHAVANYIDGHLGGLMGNILFGVMLGSTGTLGALLGLPLDIRHIAFAAANFGYALVALDFDVSMPEVLWSLLGIALIGLINLAVSFALALWTALKSRGVEFPHTGSLLQLLWQRLRAQPASFVLPPREWAREPSR